MTRLCAVAGIFLLAACTAPHEPEGAPPVALELDGQTPPPVEPAKSTPAGEPKPKKDAGAMPENVTPIAGLPNAHGKEFYVLDDYLAHLKELSAMDHPYWELMEDGRYRWNTGRGMQFTTPKFATREELLETYGFSQ